MHMKLVNKKLQDAVGLSAVVAEDVHGACRFSDLVGGYGRGRRFREADDNSLKSLVECTLRLKRAVVDAD